MSYDLNFIDRSDQQVHNKSNQKHVFKLSTQATSPTGDDEGSIAKVLDWFSRSLDSSDWLNTEDDPVVVKEPEKHVDPSKLSNDDGNIRSDRKKESGMQRQMSEAKELRATDRTSNKGQTETKEEEITDIRGRMRSHEVKDNDDEWQHPKISHLRSFWEKSNSGPKILISNSISNKEQKLGTDEENTNKPHRVSDMPSGEYNGNGFHDKFASNHVNEREQQLGPQKDTGDCVHVDINQQEDHLLMNVPTQRNDDLTPSSEHLRSLSSQQKADRRSLDAEILCATRVGPGPNPTIQSRASPSESFPPDPLLYSISQFQETPQQENELKTIAGPQLNTNLQTRGSPVSEELSLSGNSLYMDNKQGGNDGQVASKAQMHKGSREDAKRKESEDRSMQSIVAHQTKDGAPGADRSNSTRSNRHGLPQESAVERMKQVRSFWEQERSKSMFCAGKPKTFEDGKANQAKLNKRFTKSEYDLRSVGNDSDSDREHADRNRHNFTIVPLNQRIENLSPSLSMSRTQFNSLREFWGEATSDAKGSLSSDKAWTSKRKEPICAQPQSQEFKCGDPEVFCTSFTVENTRPASTKPSPPLLNRSKLPQERQVGSGPRVHTTAESRRSSKDSIKEEKFTNYQSSSGKQTRSPKSKERKNSFGGLSGRGNSLRRATSMFALSAPNEKDPGRDASPVQSLASKQKQNVSRRSSEEKETLTPRARAFVPRDYRHYLGITDKTSVHASLAPAVRIEGSEGKSGFDFDLSSPVRASTPVSSEELYSRKGNKTSQRPQWANYSSSDTGQESSVSSTSETWSISRTSSNREHRFIHLIIAVQFSIPILASATFI